MSKSVKKRDKKKKKKLTDKQILKLLKALKPHTQQIVRVNVGDKENKKKKPGEVQSSYNPPFIFPSQVYPAIINSGQPPYAPINQPQKILEGPSKREKELENLLERQKNDFEYQQQQLLMKKHIAERMFEKPYESEVEVEAFAIRPKRTYKKKPIIEEEIKFKPRETKTSQLASESISRSASLYGDINTPIQNDKYLPAVIETNAPSDQMGNIATPLSSDEFLFTPEGEIETLPEPPVVKPIETAMQQNIPEEVISQFENPEEENWAQTILKEEKAVLPPIPPEKTQIELPAIKLQKKQELAPLETEPISRFGMVIELNNAIEGGYKIPSSYISSKGSGKGFLKKNLSTQDLNKLYNEYINK